MGLIFSTTLQAFGSMFTFGWYLFIHGGWILFGAIILYILFRLYMNEVKGKFVNGQEWVLLQIKVDRENLQSTLAVEQIFAQLHAIHANFTKAQTYLEGQVNMWLSLEIVSLGGKIHFFVYTPVRFRGLVETAFYARYPQAEITAVTDYMTGLEHFDPNAPWDIWGTEFKFLKESPYPIRTYKDFEHPSAEDKIIDPIAALLEAFSRVEPYEMFGMQLVIKPLADLDWIPEAEEFAKSLRKKFLAESKETDDEEENRGGGVLSGGERKTIEAIELKASKPGWATKIRLLYIAPKDKFDGSKKSAVIGSFRQLGDSTRNGLKPDVSKTWTNYNYNMFKELERPYTEFQIEKKKKRMLEGWSTRSSWIGQEPMIMNIEELATLFHFPLASVSVPPVENITVKKGSPPPDLPIM